MKKTIITALLIAAISPAFSQQKKLPARVTIVLTEREIVRLDSAVTIGSQWTDSKGATNWFMASFTPVFEQIRKQMVIDTVKVK